MKKHYWLILIIILAAILRIGWLDKVPPSLSWDEVSLGYNAWSILKTGRDEYGQRLPLLFRAFDEYKLPGYIYTAVISEAVFGLNEWGVRLPSAILGTLTVLVFYFLVGELFCRPAISPRRSAFAHRPRWLGLPLLTAFLLAINPWHLNFSRGAFETNVSLFFFVAGMLFLLRALKKPTLYLLAVLFFSASVYTYYTTRIVIPLVLLVFSWLYRKKIWAQRKWVIISLILGFFLLLPLAKTSFLDPGARARMSQVAIFTHHRKLVEEYAEEILRKENVFWARIFYNRRLAYFFAFAENYLKSFALDFIFLNGVWMSGLVYLWEIIFLPIGIVKIFRSKKKEKWLILTWFFSVPIAAGFSIGSPNAFRNLANAALMALFSAAGLLAFFSWLKEKKIFLWGACFLGAVILFSLIRFCCLYFDYTPPRQALDWGDGHKQLALFLAKEKDNYGRIWISGDYWRPYIHLLFHLKYEPASYQKEGTPWAFDIFRFGKAQWDQEGIDLREASLPTLVEGKTMFVLSQEEYENQKAKNKQFSLEKPINGRFAQSVFWAVEL